MRLTLIAIACVLFVLAGCGDQRRAQEARGTVGSTNHDRVSASQQTISAHQLPAACDDTRYRYYESVLSVSDAQGHGPDLGSAEWKSSLMAQLGVPSSTVGTAERPTWCVAIDAALGDMHQRGFGQIMINARLESTSLRALPSDLPSAGECDYTQLADVDNVLFMIVDGQVSRIDVESKVIRLPNGLGIGSLPTEIEAEYGDRVTVAANKYDEAASDYTVKLTDQLELLFEVSQDRVTRYRIGRLPEVQWVEGCG